MDTNKQTLKTMVRGTYDLQKLRIEMGNRIIGNFKSKLGQAPSQKEEEIDEDAQEVLDDLRASYTKASDRDN